MVKPSRQRQHHTGPADGLIHSADNAVSPHHTANLGSKYKLHTLRSKVTLNILILNKFRLLRDSKTCKSHTHTVNSKRC